MKEIILNGKALTLTNNNSCASLIKQLGYQNMRLVIEINGQIVSKSNHCTTLLKAGDRVEIVKAIGGG